MAKVAAADLELIIEALEEAAISRDARSRVLDSAIRRQARRGSARPPSGTTSMHMDKARAYAELATRLKSELGRRK